MVPPGWSVFPLIVNGGPFWPGTEASVEDIFDHIEPLDVPTIYGLPRGHCKRLASTPLGVEVTLDADARKLTLDEAALAN